MGTSTDAVAAAWFCVAQYYATVIVAPLAVSALLCALWMVPMRYGAHCALCRLLLPLQAWNALDVFLVGSVAASVELEQVSEWILNTNYEEVCGDDGIIESVAHTGCFSVVGSLTPGTALLAVFVALEWALLIYTRRHIKQTHRRMAKCDRGCNKRPSLARCDWAAKPTP